MLFCITAQYTSQAINTMLDDPKTNRAEAIRKLVEAAGGKLLSIYSTAAEGPGFMEIFDVPEQSVATAIGAIAVNGGADNNLKLTRLKTPDEVTQVRGKARAIRDSYKAPGK